MPGSVRDDIGADRILAATGNGTGAVATALARKTYKGPDLEWRSVECGRYRSRTVPKDS